MPDLRLICRDCGAELLFTVGEQEFYRKHRLAPPKRCRGCRVARRQEQDRRSTAQMQEFLENAAAAWRGDRRSEDALPGA